jgi:hypothetical protein
MQFVCGLLSAVCMWVTWCSLYVGYLVQFVCGLLNAVCMWVNVQILFLLPHRLIALCFLSLSLCHVLINCCIFLNLFVLVFGVYENTTGCVTLKLL